MRNPILSALLALGLLAPAAGHGQASRGALASGTYAITEVTVVPMTRDTLIRDATVLVRDGRVAAIGASRNVQVPSNVRRVDGRGKYLIPGLADMHSHLYSDGDTPDSLARYELGVMVANGVTATRFMIGTREHFELRREIESGRIVGPQLWLASPQFTGKEDLNSRVVTTPEDARKAVKEMADLGYDFIKLTLFISPPVYDAIVSEAKAQNIRVVGHVDPQVGVARALAAGQQIEHLDNYLESVLADSAPMRESVSDRGLFRLKNWESLDYVDDAKVERIAGATARAGSFTCPTLTVFKKAFALGQSEEEIKGRPDWGIMPAELRGLYLGAREKYWKNPATEARRMRWVEVRNRLVKAIADSGGKIMTGSDTPEWFFGYGWTLHREMESLVAAGLTPYQALAAATRNPAEFLRASKEWGTIEQGKRADLVLVAGNPLEDIRNTARIEGVSVGGRWLDNAERERMIAAAARRLGA
ncbi:MAG TPA: amidohydrolase family protein [Gemmatimonadales bacterium]|nr:amidohydrolase family protein [Gemmatimonadales bacterium]